MRSLVDAFQIEVAHFIDCNADIPCAGVLVLEDTEQFIDVSFSLAEPLQFIQRIERKGRCRPVLGQRPTSTSVVCKVAGCFKQP